MEKFTKSKGSTKSERYLSAMCGRSFLSLWSYPNVYKNKDENSSKSLGKELCDLLVICGKDIIIFSDKEITFSNKEDIAVGWRRWFKKAIWKSMKQIKGAERWIRDNPNDLYLDANCTKPLPIKIDTVDECNIHRVIVATGARGACEEYYGSASGSLALFPAIKGSMHFDEYISSVYPFVVGDLDTNGGVMHLFDRVTLSIALAEFDTIIDFVNYLSKKEEWIRSGSLGFSAGEEELVAHYICLKAEKEHCKLGASKGLNYHSEQTELILSRGHYNYLLNDSTYKKEKKANEVSYFWDSLIEIFAGPMLRGEFVFEGTEQSLNYYEVCIRYMALETRLSRRYLGEAFKDAVEMAPKTKRFARVVINNDNENPTIYVLLQMPYPYPSTDVTQDYETYRGLRKAFLYIYCLTLKRKYPEIKRAIGIGCEPLKHVVGKGSSEDLVYLETDQLPAELLDELERMRREFHILVDTIPPIP